MAQQTINVGSAPNAGDGDPIRTAYSKTNANFTELYGFNVQFTSTTAGLVPPSGGGTAYFLRADGTWAVPAGGGGGFTPGGTTSQLLSGTGSNVTVSTGLSLSGGVLTATGGGSGTVNSGTTNTLAYYPGNGTAVSPLTLGTGLSISSGALNATGGSGSGTVNSGAAGQFGIYAGTGTAISGTSSLTQLATGRVGIGAVTDDGVHSIQTAAGAAFGGSSVVTAAGPGWLLTDTAQPTNQKNFQLVYAAGTAYLRFINDDNSTGIVNSVAITRTGLVITASTSVNFVTPSLLQNGSAISGTGITDAPSDGTTYGRRNAAWVAAGGSGSGTVNTGTTGTLAFYAANGTAVSPVTLGTGLTITGTGPYTISATASATAYLSAGVSGVVSALPGGAGAVVLRYVFARPCSLAANLASPYAPQARTGTAATATAAFGVAKQAVGAGSATSFGTVSISSTGTVTASTTATSFAVGDELIITAPSPADATLADFAMTITGTWG